MRARVANHYPAHPFRTVSEEAFSEVRPIGGPKFAHLEGDLWAVQSSQGGYYRVDLASESCDCPDYEHRAGPLGIACKHVYAVAIAHAARRSGVSVRTITAAGDPFKAAGARRLRRERVLRKLRELQDRYRHDLIDERQELRDEISRLRRGLS